FSSYGFNYRKRPGGGTTYQEFYKEDTITFSNNIQDRLRTGLSHNFRVGADFTLNDKNSITASAFYRISDQENFTDVYYTTWYNRSKLVNRTLRAEEEIEDRSNIDLELNYTKTFDREKPKLTAAIQYRDGGETEDAEIIENSYND